MSSSKSEGTDRPVSRGRVRATRSRPTGAEVRSADERTQRRLRREAVRRAGITLAGSNTLRRVAEHISRSAAGGRGNIAPFTGGN